MTIDIIFPSAVRAQGMSAVAVVTGGLTKTGPLVATEVKAATSLTISCFVYGGRLDATSETNKGSAPPRMCDDTEREQEGRTKYSLADIQYVYDPQGTDSVDGNKAKVLMAPGAEVWLVERLGLSAKEVDWTAGQRVNLHHVRLGKQRRTQTGDDEFAEFSITQSVTYLEDPIYDVALVA